MIPAQSEASNHDQLVAGQAKQRHLVDLMIALFPTVEEFRRFVALSHLRSLRAELPPGSLASESYNLVEILESRGQIDESLFLALMQERPLRARLIVRVASEWQIQIAHHDTSEEPVFRRRVGLLALASCGLLTTILVTAVALSTWTPERPVVLPEIDSQREMYPSTFVPAAIRAPRSPELSRETPSIEKTANPPELTKQKIAPRQTPQASDSIPSLTEKPSSESPSVTPTADPIPGNLEPSFDRCRDFLNVATESERINATIMVTSETITTVSIHDAELDPRLKRCVTRAIKAARVEHWRDGFYPYNAEIRRH